MPPTGELVTVAESRPHPISRAPACARRISPGDGGEGGMKGDGGGGKVVTDAEAVLSAEGKSPSQALHGLLLHSRIWGNAESWSLSFH